MEEPNGSCLQEEAGCSFPLVKADDSSPQEELDGNFTGLQLDNSSPLEQLSDSSPIMEQIFALKVNEAYLH